MATTNVSSCVRSSSHTSGAMDDPNDDEDKEDDVSELYFVWYMLCYVFLIIKIVMLCGSESVLGPSQRPPYSTLINRQHTA